MMYYIQTTASAESTGGAIVSFKPNSSYTYADTGSGETITITVTNTTEKPQPVIVYGVADGWSIHSRYYYTPAPPDPALLAEQEARKKAEKKAKKLLLSFLGSSRYRLYRKKKYIDVDAPSGKRYRVHEGKRTEVFLPGKEEADHELCILSNADIPRPDFILHQILMIQLQEEEYARIANVHRRSVSLWPAGLAV